MKFINVKTKLGNVRLQKFFLEDNKTWHPQLHLPRLDSDITKY